MAKGSASTKEIDRGARRIVNDYKRMSGAFVTVGVHEKAGEYKPDPGQEALPVAQVAFWNEYGTKRAPARSVFRWVADKLTGQIRAKQRELLDQVTRGKITTDKALGSLGLYLASLFRKRLLSSIPPPNAPATLDGKVGTKTLVDSRLYSRSISHEVGRE